jgi:NAD(P)-dependent dehydrogenase (short-subunit alcohol dehydrogenase family)
LTKAIAIENGSKGITSNAINLGYSNIGMGINELTPDFRESTIKKIPLSRFCDPDEILATVKFILANEYLNGSIIDLNGGIA